MASEKYAKLSTFHVGDYCFGIEVSLVQEVLRRQKIFYVPLADNAVQGLINIRGQIITAISLRQRLQFTGKDNPDEHFNVISISSTGPVSFIVDSIGDVINLPRSLYEPTPTHLVASMRDMIGGVYKHEKQLLLLLDVNKAVMSHHGLWGADSPKIMN